MDRRRTDHEYEDHRAERDDPAELRLGWNGKSLRARGLALVLVLVAVAMSAIAFYIASRFETLTTDQHRRLSISQDRTSCMVSMSQSDRERFRSDYRPGAFKQWCPWVDE